MYAGRPSALSSLTSLRAVASEPKAPTCTEYPPFTGAVAVAARSRLAGTRGGGCGDRGRLGRRSRRGGERAARPAAAAEARRSSPVGVRLRTRVTRPCGSAGGVALDGCGVGRGSILGAGSHGAAEIDGDGARAFGACRQPLRPCVELFGPDSSSGTRATASTTRILAPISRAFSGSSIARGL